MGYQKLTPFEHEPLLDSQWGAVWANNRYRVWVRHISDGAIHLSIKRHDKKPIRTWRDLQWIKNQLAGEERWAMEVFPPMSKLVDTSNQYHLWVAPQEVPLPPFLGNDSPVVVDGDGTSGWMKPRQQPIPEWYPDPMTEEEAERRKKELDQV